MPELARRQGCRADHGPHRLRAIAREAVFRANRPAGADPRTVALALGVLAFPCAEEDASALGQVADEKKFRFVWADDEEERAGRVWAGLARSLLLRSGVRPTRRLADALARELIAARNATEAH